MIDGNGMAPLELHLWEMDLIRSVLSKCVRSSKYTPTEVETMHDILDRLSSVREDLKLSIDEN